MTTRSTSDKDKIANLFKTAIENQSKAKSRTSTHATSTPTGPSNPTPKQVNFSLDDSEIVGEKTEIFEFTPELPLDDSGDETIRPGSNIVFGTKRKDTDGSMTNNNPFAPLKYAVEAVPFFDGKNIPLTYFIEGCEEGKSMLPAEAEPQFTRIIRTKIVGEARRTIQDQNFDSIAQLTKYLEQIYGPSKTVYQLQGELGSVYQKTEEEVVTYANRVKILGKQILEAYKNSGAGPASQNIKASLEKDMCKCFIRGLKPEIEQRIARNLGVQETVADALRIERELSSMADLRQGQGSVTNKILNANRLRETCQICYKEGHPASNCRKLTQSSYNETGLGTEILVCQICKKRGHSADKCRLRDPQNRRPVNVLQGNNIICQLCSKSGHNAKTCRTNNNNNLNKSFVICQWCDRPGHSANNCWKNQNEQRDAGNKTRITCQVCNNFGHFAKDCRSKVRQNSTSENSLFCRYCKGPGHLIDNCELRLRNNNRRTVNNQGNSDGPSKSGVRQGPERISHPAPQKAQ